MRDRIGRGMLAAFGIGGIVAGTLGVVGVVKVDSVVPSRLFGLSTALLGVWLVRMALFGARRAA